MSKAFEEISAGLDDAVKHARGQSSKVVVHEPEPIDVKAIRQKTGMSQQRFCATFPPTGENPYKIKGIHRYSLVHGSRILSQ